MRDKPPLLPEAIVIEPPLFKAVDPAESVLNQGGIVEEASDRENPPIGGQGSLIRFLGLVSYKLRGCSE